MRSVGATATVQHIVTGATNQGVVAARALEGIVAQIAYQQVVAGIACNTVITRQGVISGASSTGNGINIVATGAANVVFGVRHDGDGACCASRCASGTVGDFEFHHLLTFGGLPVLGAVARRVNHPNVNMCRKFLGNGDSCLVVEPNDE